MQDLYKARQRIVTRRSLMNFSGDNEPSCQGQTSIFQGKDPGWITKELFLLIPARTEDTMSFQKIFTYVGIISIRDYMSSEDRKLTWRQNTWNTKVKRLSKLLHYVSI